MRCVLGVHALAPRFACGDRRVGCDGVWLAVFQADTFGPKYVGPNHGRMLLWSSLACMVGPATLLVRTLPCPAFLAPHLPCG